MTTDYQFVDSTGITRLDGTLVPDPAGNSVPTGWSEDASNPANVDSNGGALEVSSLSSSGLTGAVSATRYVGGTATVAPTTGTFAVGDYVISQNGSAWVCTVAGTPGTWVALGSVLLAPKASPTFTGVPAAPTAAADTNSTQLATTAFVDGQAGGSNPIIDGTAAPGTSLRYSRQDHVHPTDTTRAPTASPTLTGTVTVPAAAAATSATKLADLSSALTITSGTLPNTGAWASGTAKANPVARQVTVNVEFVTNGTANAATCAIAISSDNVTFTTVGTLTASVAVNTVGAVTLVAPVNLPSGWFVKLTFAQGTVAASIYY